MVDEDKPTAFDAVSDWIEIALDEITRCWKRVPGAQVDRLVEILLRSERIVLAGTGKTCLVLEANAVRFREIGMQVEVWSAGAALTPVEAGARGSCALLACPSGDSARMLGLAQELRKTGGEVVACIGRAGSPLEGAVDAPVLIDAFTPGNGRPPSSQQRAGALFDQMLLLLVDAVTETLARLRPGPGGPTIR